MLSEPQKSLFHGVTAELYRAAIGPRGQDAYLQHFLRFDMAGKTDITWHWPASLITLNWLIYRQMWRGVFIYLATLLGLFLLIFGAGKLLFGYSSVMGVMLLLIFLVAACVVPGLYANAWYHEWCNEKITVALREAKDLKGACARLAAQASSERRWGVLALANGALILLLGAVLAVTLRSKPPVVDEGEVILAAAPAPVLAASAAASEPASAASVPAPAASVPAAAASVAAAAPIEAPVEPPLEKKLPEPLPAPVKEKPPVSPKPAPVPPAAAAKPPAEKPRAAAEPAKPPAEKPRAAAEPAKPPVRGSWFVQVGAFGQEANAQKTLATLKAAGLPTSSDTQVGKNGRLTRVRVGPFTSEAAAAQAAEQVKALDLPAVLIKI
jgi:cell division septation protein DedD